MGIRGIHGEGITTWYITQIVELRYILMIISIKYGEMNWDAI